MKHYFSPIRLKLLTTPQIGKDVRDQAFSYIIHMRRKWYNNLAILLMYALEIPERI
jgi:ADP-heptose:LPS heptosyltransferase